MYPTFDERDQRILDRRAAALAAVPGVRVGDFIEFSCGTVRRVAHIWGDDLEAGVQSCHVGASFYLGNGYVSMSGSLFLSVPKHSLTPTGRTQPGRVWFFHHDDHRAHNGVSCETTFRVFACDRPAPAV